jgi:hypothetical protein
MHKKTKHLSYWLVRTLCITQSLESTFSISTAQTLLNYVKKKLLLLNRLDIMGIILKIQWILKKTLSQKIGKQSESNWTQVKSYQNIR